MDPTSIARNYRERVLAQLRVWRSYRTTKTRPDDGQDAHVDKQRCLPMELTCPLNGAAYHRHGQDFRRSITLAGTLNVPPERTRACANFTVRGKYVAVHQLSTELR